MGLARAPHARDALATAALDVLVARVEDDLHARLPPPDDDAILAFLKAHAAATAGAEKLSLRHAFRRLPRAASDDQRARARAAMQALRARLLAGEDFAALARAESDSETAKFGGQITPVARGQLPPAAEAIVWRLAPGEISEVVDTPVGLHVFRLEARLASEPLTPDQARAWARHRLTSEARLAARRARQDAWRAASGAVYRPDALADPRTPPEAPVFQLGDTRVTRRDLDARHAALGFARRRLRAPAGLLEELAWRHLALWHARHARLARSPETARAVERAQRRALAQLAAARRIAAWRARLPENELRALFDLDPARFADHATRRVRVVVLARREGRTLDQAFDELTALARDVHDGKRDLADAARELSDDPSADQGGDLGFVTLRELGEWAGPTCSERIAAQATGALGAPLLVESYREEKLEYEPSAYLLARVEAQRQPAAPRFEDVRAEVAQVYAQRHWQAADAALRADVLRETQAEILVDAGPR